MRIIHNYKINSHEQTATWRKYSKCSNCIHFPNICKFLKIRYVWHMNYLWENRSFFCLLAMQLRQFFFQSNNSNGVISGKGYSRVQYYKVWFGRVDSTADSSSDLMDLMDNNFLEFQNILNRFYINTCGLVTPQ